MRTPSTPSVARYYHTARTAHIERLADFRPSWFFYSVSRADFDEDLARNTPRVRRASVFKAAEAIRRSGASILEVPEPLAIKLWPQLLYLHTYFRIYRLVTRRRVLLVTYAMENYAPARKLKEFSRLPEKITRPLARLVNGYLLRTLDRIVFATREAEIVYENLNPKAINRSALQRDLIWALPSAHPNSKTSEKFNEVPEGQQLVFLGTFETRKGIHRLCDVWPLVEARLPSANLLLMGKAGDIERVRSFAEHHARVELLEDPTRSSIFSNLLNSKSLVLFSQPWKGWKEQVGLPIVEALSVGCEIVASDESGIQHWLRDHGHQVLPWDAPDQELADALVFALTSSRSAERVQQDLPEVDGRLAAELWLTRQNES